MLKFTKSSNIFQLKATQQLPISKKEGWSFLSNPKNLQKITPAEMGFEITSPYTGDKVYEGQIITYKVYPFKGIKSYWVTEITKVKEEEYFIDEQRFGPYKMWHHEHFIEENKDGVLMTDIISYKIPFGFFGRLIEPFLVQKQLKKVFSYREKILNEIFAK
jgi:ligand-binding SRPBCC domain-containing protein